MKDEVFVYPLTQGIGAPSQPVVKKGDKVKRGEKIAKISEGVLGSNIHSSVNGTVKKVTKSEIVIQPKDTASMDYEKLPEGTPLDRIREAGLVGLGGAGFPTYVKLGKPFTGHGTVIINAAECEPILSHNIAYIEKNPAKVLRGLTIVMEIMNAADGVVAIKGTHGEAVESLKNANKTGNIRIHLLKDMYPMGEERAIIREVLGTLLPVTSLPLDANAVIVNAETAYRIAEAVDEGKPLIDKDMTVAGKLNGDTTKIYFDIPIGKSVASIIEQAGGISTDDYGEIIMGGPFTGKRTSLDAPIVKTCGGILAAECFPKGPQKIGLLVCACGADKQRLAQIAESLGSEVVGVEYCKQAQEVKNTRKCENPGICPGQVQKIIALKKAGAQAVLISNCTDCSNTVMSCAPQLKLPVYHCTDGALRAVNHKLVRRIKA